MRFLAMAALLAPVLITAAPSLPHDNSLVVVAASSGTNFFHAQRSCFLILVRGVLHCHQEVVRDLDSGFPDEEQLKPYVDYRNCLLGGASGCAEPPLLSSERQVLGSVDEGELVGLLEDFDRTHPAFALEGLIEEAHAPYGHIYPRKRDIEVAASVGECCLRNCAFTWWWGPVGFAACMAMCTCPG